MILSRLTDPIGQVKYLISLVAALLVLKFMGNADAGRDRCMMGRYLMGMSWSSRQA